MKQKSEYFKKLQVDQDHTETLVKSLRAGAVEIGTRLKVPFKLAWSCHNNIIKACNRSSNCEARIEAFNLNKINNPIAYE